MPAELVRPLSLRGIRQRLAAGDTNPARVIAEALERIADTDRSIHAFIALAPETAIAQAGDARGPLAGVPLGIKDIFDTADMPTAYGSPIYAGHRPAADAALVALARARGAAILGKTATTEFAWAVPAQTRNPHDPSRTPGGSSSGSAAAVAAGLVAGAFGSQTAGSVIRPAAFCGVAGYKPSFRLLPTVGMKCFAWSLDTAGLFASGVADVAALAALVTGRDLFAEPPADASGLRIGLYRSTIDGRLHPEIISAWEEAARHLEAAGAKLIEIEEPPALAQARAIQPVIQDFEGALALSHERLAENRRLSPSLAQLLAEGAAIPPDEYDRARSIARHGRKATTALFSEIDALLVPSALGPAPEGLASTGDPIMNRLWTLAGVPCVNVPGLRTPCGLPLGLSVIARFGRDRQALSIAALLENLLR